MKILYVCPSPTMYGDNIALMSIMPVLMANGVEPLFLLQREGDFSRYLQCNGYKYIVCKFTYNNIYSLSNPKISYLKRLIKGTIWDLRTKQYVKRAIDSLRNFSPQIIHTNNSANSFGLRLAKKLGVPHVWHLREYMDLDHNSGYFPSKRAFEKILDNPFNSCICITKDVGNHFKTISKKYIIYDGIIKPSRNTFTIPEKDDTLLYVGRLLETKGVYDIVKAFAKISDSFSNYTLQFLGDGDKEVKKHLLELVETYKIKDKVQFLGYQTNVSDYMKRAKAIIVPSRFEAFGLITAEAMDNGCLVIGRNTAGTKVQFDNGVLLTGSEIALRFDSFFELETSIRRALTMSSEAYKEMVTQAHNTALYYYSVDKSATDVISLYSKILNK